MPYSIFLDGLLLPVTPSKLSVKIKNNNKTVNLISGEDVNILKSAGLTEISFDASLPQSRYPFASYPDGFHAAAYYLEAIKRLKTSLKPFVFICTRTTPGGAPLFDTVMTVSLEDYTISDDSRNGLDVDVSIKLKQYIIYGTKTLTLEDNGDGTQTAYISEQRPTGAAPNAKTYTTVEGDTLWMVAKRMLGDGARYTEIYTLNIDRVTNPNAVAPGTVLILP